MIDEIYTEDILNYCYQKTELNRYIAALFCALTAGCLYITGALGGNILCWVLSFILGGVAYYFIINVVTWSNLYHMFEEDSLIDEETKENLSFLGSTIACKIAQKRIRIAKRVLPAEEFQEMMEQYIKKELGTFKVHYTYKKNLINRRFKRRSK